MWHHFENQLDNATAKTANFSVVDLEGLFSK
jgi:hypothetical protein